MRQLCCCVAWRGGMVMFAFVPFSMHFVLTISRVARPTQASEGAIAGRLAREPGQPEGPLRKSPRGSLERRACHTGCLQAAVRRGGGLL